VERKIARAGLDVFEHEPAIHPALFQMGNVIILTHMGKGRMRF